MTETCHEIRGAAHRVKKNPIFPFIFTLLVAFVWNFVFHNIRLKKTLFEGGRGKLNGHLTLPSGFKLWLMLGPLTKFLKGTLSSV